MANSMASISRLSVVEEDYNEIIKFSLIPEYDEYIRTWHRIQDPKPKTKLLNYEELQIGHSGSELEANNTEKYRI